MGAIKSFLRHEFRHFNAASLVDAAQAWTEHSAKGGKMFLSMAGAMSTAELGISVARLIRAGKVHAMCVTGANLEEDLFNLVAHEHYVRIRAWRYLTPEDDAELYEHELNRVTDTCIPEKQAMARVENVVLDLLKDVSGARERVTPYQLLSRVVRTGKLEYDTDPENSWLLAAIEHDVPVYVPGWEDSTLGNMMVGRSIKGEVSLGLIESGLEQMADLVRWYQEHDRGAGVGFFQIGGGIAGDFPICVVPLIKSDLGKECGFWRYFCQISDSTTSYGSYSGALPTEKITWAKIGPKTPQYVIESDATIVFPLIAAYVLDQ